MENENRGVDRPRVEAAVRELLIGIGEARRHAGPRGARV